METEQLKYFVSAAQNGNFSDTAKEFYMTQPAISHRIADLEKQMGTKLFIRNSKGVSLTKAGEMFLEDAKQILDMEAKSLTRIMNINSTAKHLLKIGYLASPCKYFLPDVINTVLQKYPSVDVDITRMDAHIAKESIDTEKLDIYFAVLDDMDNHTDYDMRQIHADNYSLICRNDHPCLDNIQIDYKKLSNEPFILLNPDIAGLMTKQIYKVCRDLGFVPKIKKTFDLMDDVLFSVECGMGITILPQKIRHSLKADLAYIPLDSSSTACSIGVCWKKKSDNPAIEWFIEELGNYMVSNSYIDSDTAFNQ